MSTTGHTKDQMTHRERVHAALRGDETDRPPISMWRHFFEEETDPERMAEAMLAFQRRFDWDFMKVNPRASYHAEDWGLEMRYGGDASPTVVDTPVRQPEDWTRLEVFPPDQGVLGEHLRALETISQGLADEVPFLMTVFTPLSIVSRLAPSEEVFLQHLRESWEQVRHALKVVTETFTGFSRACLDRGASGLFYATTSWATTAQMTEEEYRRVARPYDLQVLNALPSAEFHILHVCRDHNMVHAMRDYPVHAFNWDTRGEGNPSLAQGASRLGQRAVIGGVDHRRGLVESSPHDLASEVRGIRVAMGDRGWMLGGGCTFPPNAPEANLDAVREAVAGP